MREGLSRSRSRKLPATALLLAGGKGVRMGGNKLYLSRDGGLLLEDLLAKLELVFEAIVLCCGAGDASHIRALAGPLLERYSVRCAEDRVEGRGPLEGLRCGLRTMGGRWGFLFACDMPDPNETVIRHLWARTPASAQVSCARLDGYLMPIHAFYRSDCARFADEALARGERKLTSFYDDVSLNVVEEEFFSVLPGYRRSFAGYNTPAELRILSGTV